MRRALTLVAAAGTLSLAPGAAHAIDDEDAQSPPTTIDVDTSQVVTETATRVTVEHEDVDTDDDDSDKTGLWGLLGLLGLAGLAGLAGRRKHDDGEYRSTPPTGPAAPPRSSGATGHHD